MKLYICTAEPSNFVPKELQKAAKELNLDAEIIDLTHVVLVEQNSGSGIYCVCPETHEVTQLEVNSETLVIPRLNEHHLDVKLSVLKRMEFLGAKLLNSPESMELCNDKLMTHVRLCAAGIRTPSTMTVSGTDDVEAIVDWREKTVTDPYPVIVKTLRGTHGIGVMKLDSRASLVSVAQTLLGKGIDFIIQEFLKHDKSARMIMIGEELLAANLRGQPKDKGEFRTNSHLGSETEPYEPSEAEIGLGKLIVETFGSKFCAIDYIIRDQELIVLEVNGSPGLENIQKNWPNRNLAADVVKYLLPTEPTPQADQTNSVPVPNLQVELPNYPPAAPEQKGISEIEHVNVHQIFEGEGRVDTGAKYSSLHADTVTFDDEWVKFRRGDVTYRVPTLRKIKIKNVHAGESSVRALVLLDVTIADQRLNRVEFTINDRKNMKYEVLVGRNIIEKLGLPVLVQKQPEAQALSTDGGADSTASVEVVEEE